MSKSYEALVGGAVLSLVIGSFFAVCILPDKRPLAVQKSHEIVVEKHFKLADCEVRGSLKKACEEINSAFDTALTTNGSLRISVSPADPEGKTLIITTVSPAP